MSTTLFEDELFKLKQRHLTQSQRALIAAELATAKSGGHHSLGITMDVAAKQMRVGANYVSLPRAVKRIAPEMIAEIRAGKMTLSHASKILAIFITPARAGNRYRPNRGLGVIRPGF